MCCLGVLLQDLSGYKASKIIGKIDTILIPIGTLEPHGPHSSILTDALIAEWMARDIDKLIGDKILVAPTINFGHTWHLSKMPGSHDVPGGVLADYVYEVIKGFKSWQIKYAVIVNGHGGNLIPLNEAAERSADIGIKTLILSWWLGATNWGLQGIVQDIFGHGGEAETSIIMSIGENLVDYDLIPKDKHNYAPAGFYDRYDPDVNDAAYLGSYTGSPFLASKEKGDKLREKIAEKMVEHVEAFREGTFVPSNASAWG